MSVDAAAIAELLKRKEFAALESELAATPIPALLRFWNALNPLERLVAFKLLDAPRALELFEKAPLEEKYFLFGGFPLAAIAPVLEGLPLMQKRHFIQLPRAIYERMYRALLDASRAKEPQRDR